MLVESWELFNYLADNGWLRHNRITFGEVAAITHDFLQSEYCNVRLKERLIDPLQPLPTWNKPRRRRQADDEHAE